MNNGILLRPHILAGLIAVVGLTARAQEIQLVIEENLEGSYNMILENRIDESENWSFESTLFAVNISPAATGNPIAPFGWRAQVLTLADWSLPIGDVSTNPSWERFTGAAFTSVFTPADTVLGYYQTFAADGSGMWSYIPQYSVKPGESLAGFSYPGMVGSDFIAAGPNDSTTFVGNASDNPTRGVASYAGTTIVVPEPSTAMFGGLSLIIAFCRRMRSQHNATKA